MSEFKRLTEEEIDFSRHSGSGELSKLVNALEAAYEEIDSLDEMIAKLQVSYEVPPIGLSIISKLKQLVRDIVQLFDPWSSYECEHGFTLPECPNKICPYTDTFKLYSLTMLERDI